MEEAPLLASQSPPSRVLPASLSWVSPSDVLLCLGALACCWVLYHTAGAAVVHVLSGLVLLGAVAWTLVRGQLASKPLHRAGWFIATGGVFFLFMYWAFTVVFRAPNYKEGVGCGGVHFIHDEL
mmetsp:Transcript_29743/g.68272  ORF Transcript_29743/g.68272 Transcript_29743/m.68272 type:complete len:124 (+) Transcript_29743:45-416(+)